MHYLLHNHAQHNYIFASAFVSDSIRSDTCLSLACYTQGIYLMHYLRMIFKFNNVPFYLFSHSKSQTFYGLSFSRVWTGLNRAGRTPIKISFFSTVLLQHSVQINIVQVRSPYHLQLNYPSTYLWSDRPLMAVEGASPAAVAVTQEIGYRRHRSGKRRRSERQSTTSYDSCILGTKFRTGLHFFKDRSSLITVHSDASFNVLRLWHLQGEGRKIQKGTSEKSNERQTYSLQRDRRKTYS